MQLFKNLALFFICIFATFSDGHYLVSDQLGIGRRFDGIGGLSGGGPNFGASLQILKVEIGGDDQSKDGTEASHMHDEWEQNYNRGYEWWLMTEAKKRNPNIKLYGLPWAWPYWLGNPDTKQPFDNLTKTAMYIVNWITGAKAFHNLTIDYIGIWNEKECSFQYILTLKQALMDKNLTTEIIACDGKFLEFYSLSQPQFQQTMDSIYAYGVHYPGTLSPILAIESDKTLWSSEDYSTYNNDVGAGCLARSHDHSICIRPLFPVYTVTSQTATFKFNGSYANLQKLWLWKTQLNFDDTPSSVFQPQGLVSVTDGVITLNLDVDQIYTLTTVNRGNHGDFSTPLASRTEFPLPYEDNFQDYSISQEPYYLTPQVGSWEIVGDNGSQFARQTVLAQPVPWCYPNHIPFAVIGNGSWIDMSITATVRIPSVNGTDLVFVGIQVQTSAKFNCQLDNTKGIFFWIQKSKHLWQLTTDLTRFKLLTYGLLEDSIQTNQWYTLSLSLKANIVKSTINGIPAASYTLTNNDIKNGFAAIGSGSYGYSDIKHLTLSMPN